MTRLFPDDVTYVVVPAAPCSPMCILSPDQARRWVAMFADDGVPALIVTVPGFHRAVPSVLSFLDASGAP